MKSLSQNPHKTKAVNQVLRQIPYNLFAVGVGSTPNEENAFIASWVTQCSFDPPLIAVGVYRQSRNLELIKESGVFTLNLLNEQHANIARRLVKRHTREGDKLGQISHFEEVTGAPLLRDACAYLECKCTQIMDTEGDHCLVIGQVVNAEQKTNDRPLACSDVGWNYAG